MLLTLIVNPSALLYLGFLLKHRRDPSTTSRRLSGCSKQEDERTSTIIVKRKEKKKVRLHPPLPTKSTVTTFSLRVTDYRPTIKCETTKTKLSLKQTTKTTVTNGQDFISVTT